jgi:hypothetical protein
MAIAETLLINLVIKSLREIELEKIRCGKYKINLKLDFAWFLIFTETIVTRVLLILKTLTFLRKSKNKDITNFIIFEDGKYYSFIAYFNFYNMILISLPMIVYWKFMISPLPPTESFYNKPMLISFIFTIPILFNLLLLYFDKLNNRFLNSIGIILVYISFYIIPFYCHDIYKTNGNFILLNYITLLRNPNSLITIFFIIVFIIALNLTLRIYFFSKYNLENSLKFLDLLKKIDLYLIPTIIIVLTVLYYHSIFGFSKVFFLGSGSYFDALFSLSIITTIMFALSFLTTKLIRKDKVIELAKLLIIQEKGKEYFKKICLEKKYLYFYQFRDLFSIKYNLKNCLFMTNIKAISITITYLLTFFVLFIFVYVISSEWHITNKGSENAYPPIKSVNINGYYYCYPQTPYLHSSAHISDFYEVVKSPCIKRSFNPSAIKAFDYDRDKFLTFESDSLTVYEISSQEKLFTVFTDDFNMTKGYSFQYPYIIYNNFLPLSDESKSRYSILLNIETGVQTQFVFNQFWFKYSFNDFTKKAEKDKNTLKISPSQYETFKEIKTRYNYNIWELESINYSSIKIMNDSTLFFLDQINNFNNPDLNGNSNIWQITIRGKKVLISEPYDNKMVLEYKIKMKDYFLYYKNQIILKNQNGEYYTANTIQGSDSTNFAIKIHNEHNNIIQVKSFKNLKYYNRINPRSERLYILACNDLGYKELIVWDVSKNIEINKIIDDEYLYDYTMSENYLISLGKDLIFFDINSLELIYTYSNLYNLIFKDNHFTSIALGNDYFIVSDREFLQMIKCNKVTF